MVNARKTAHELNTTTLQVTNVSVVPRVLLTVTYATFTKKKQNNSTAKIAWKATSWIIQPRLVNKLLHVKLIKS